MSKVKITEGQYKLLRETDESSYETVADLLLNSAPSNKEVGLYLIKSQDLDIDRIVDNILKKKSMFSPEDIETLLYERKGQFFFRVIFTYCHVSIVMKVNATFLEVRNIRGCGSATSHTRTFDLTKEKDEFYKFLHGCIEAFKFDIKSILHTEINNLPKEIE
jgi:hypothetical protein